MALILKSPHQGYQSQLLYPHIFILQRTASIKKEREKEEKIAETGTRKESGKGKRNEKSERKERGRGGGKGREGGGYDTC